MNRTPIKVLVAVTYVVMIAVNYLAKSLPLNGVRTGEVSDAYANLFTPAGLTFSVWGLIYLLLGAHVLYQLGLFRGSDAAPDNALLTKVGIYFSISSVANTAWIVAWHHSLIGVSLALIVVILGCLIVITRTVAAAQPTTRERWLIGVPFGVYFGWTTVATVANATVLLVSLGWDGFGLPDSTWAVIVLILAMVIGTTTMLRHRDIAYGMVLIWAYLGIVLKHQSAEGWHGQYPTVTFTAIGCLAVFVLAVAFIVVRGRQRAATVGV